MTWMLVFCDLCNRLVDAEDAKGFPEENPKEWVCKRCLKNKVSYDL